MGEKVAVDKTSAEYKALIGTLREELREDFPAASFAKVEPALAKMEALYARLEKSERGFSMYTGLDGKQERLSETGKALAEFGQGKSLTSEGMIRHYVPGWEPARALAAAGFIKALYMAHKRLDMPAAVVKAMGETQGSAGGFVVPIEFRPELLRLMIEDQVVRPRAFTMPMNSDTLWVPRIVDTSHATTLHGGMKGVWQAESSDLSTNEGDPTFGLVQLIAKKFAGFVTVPNELIMDSPIAVLPLLGTLARETMGFQEDISAFWGSGASTPGQLLGFMKSPALITVTRDTASHITYPDILAMQSHMFPKSYARCVWVGSPSILPDLGQMSVAVGTGGTGVFIANIPGQTAAQSFPMTILGRPLVLTEKGANLGTAGDLALCDYSYYLLGDRMDLRMEVSQERYFEKDQTAVRFVERLDGTPWINGTLTGYDTNTYSAFIALN